MVTVETRLPWRRWGCSAAAWENVMRVSDAMSIMRASLGVNVSVRRRMIGQGAGTGYRSKRRSKGEVRRSETKLDEGPGRVSPLDPESEGWITRQPRVEVVDRVPQRPAGAIIPAERGRDDARPAGPLESVE